MGLSTVNTHDPKDFLRKKTNNTLATTEEHSDFKFTDRLKAPLPDFKNIEYKGDKPWKSTEPSKDFIKKVNESIKRLYTVTVCSECAKNH